MNDSLDFQSSRINGNRAQPQQSHCHSFGTLCQAPRSSETLVVGDDIHPDQPCGIPVSRQRTWVNVIYSIWPWTSDYGRIESTRDGCPMRQCSPMTARLAVLFGVSRSARIFFVRWLSGKTIQSEEVEKKGGPASTELLDTACLVGLLCRDCRKIACVRSIWCL